MLQGAQFEPYSATFDFAVKVTSREGMMKVTDRWWGWAMSIPCPVVQKRKLLAPLAASAVTVTVSPGCGAAGLALPPTTVSFTGPLP